MPQKVGFIFLLLSFPYRWLGLIGQCRPKKLISAIKTELQNADGLELAVFRDAAKHFLDKSLYSIALATQLSLPPSFLMWSTERQGQKEGYRNKFKLYHQARISFPFMLYAPFSHLPYFYLSMVHLYN